MTDTPELLPCPHCAAESAHRVFVSGSDPARFYIRCRSCGAQGPVSDHAEAAWNTRVPSALDKLARALADAAEEFFRSVTRGEEREARAKWNEALIAYREARKAGTP